VRTIYKVSELFKVFLLPGTLEGVEFSAVDLLDIKNLLSYTEWANDLAMEAAGKLPEEHLRRDFGISHRSIFAHGWSGVDLAGTLARTIAGEG